MTNIIKIGVIASAHGVRGQVKIHTFLDDPEAIFSYSPITDATGKRTFKLKKQGVKDRQVIASIEGIDDRNASELLRATELFAPAPAASKNAENIWSYAELTGLEARLLDGTIYGKVTGVYNFGAGDLLDIELPGGKSEMLPFTKTFVGDVKPEEDFLIVFPPEYTEAEE